MRAPRPAKAPLEVVCGHIAGPAATLGDDGRIRHCNAAFAALGAGSVAGRPLTGLLDPEGDGDLQGSLSAGRPFRAALRVDGANDEAFDCDLRPLRDRDGECVGWLAAGTPDPPRERDLPAELTLVDQLGHGVLIHRRFVPLYANRSGARALGYADNGELLRCPSMLTHLPIEWHVRAAQHHDWTLDGNVPRRPRWFPCFTVDGQSIWVEGFARRIDWQGEPAEMLSMSDVTEQVSSRGSELLLREAVDNLFDTFVLYDADERVVLSNRRFHEAFPFFPPQDRITGTKMVELVRLAVRHGAVAGDKVREDPETWIRDFVQWRRENDSTLTEDSWPDGRWDLVQEQHTRSGGFVSVRTDMTERKRVEAALRESEARLARALEDRTAQLEGILESIEQGITVIGPDHRVVLANRGFARIYGLPETLTRPGTHVSEYIRFRIGQQRHREGERRDEPLDHIIARRLAQYEQMTREHTLDHLLDGRVIDVHRQRLPNGTIVSTHTDVTERIAADRELQRQRDALYQSEKMSALGTLLAGVAHELNNPLSVVVGISTLMEDQLAGHAAEQAGRVRAAATRCARIVRTFLSMARQRSTVRAPTRLNDLVDHALELLAYQLRSAGVETALELDASLPEIEADPDQLIQVIVNLIVNAQQAMMEVEGPRRLRVRTSQDAGQLVLEICDSGPGVDPALRARIFEPFFTTKAEGVGTGIGLAICHGMVGGHDGRIDVLDGPDGGARFVVSLPLSASRPSMEPEVDGAEATPFTGSVLVVDDDQDVREFVADALELDGHDVDQAANGHEALTRLEGRRYAAIVCDLRMPQMDGPTLFARLRETAPDACDRMVFLTGDLLGGQTEAFLDSSARPFLEKPVTPRELCEVVRAVIGTAGSART